MKHYLFVMRKPAHSGDTVQEMLDIILTAAAFDQRVSLLLLDDGVFHIKNGQNPQHLALKDTAAMFNALKIYDVHTIYVEQESLQERGLNAEDLMLPTLVVARRAVSALMNQFDVIFSG